MAKFIFKKQPAKKPNQLGQFGKQVGTNVLVMLAASAVLSVIDTTVALVGQKVTDLKTKRATAKAEEAAPTAA